MGIASSLVREFQSWFRTGAAREVVEQAHKAVAPDLAKVERMAADRLVLSQASKELAEAATRQVSQAADEVAEVATRQVSQGEKWLASRRVAMNRIHGDRREMIVERFLKNRFPETDGYAVHAEQYWRDRVGQIARDAESGEARRLDFVVFQGESAVSTVEVTSHTASKVAQTAKEASIRKAGGRYLINPATGELVKVPASLRTQVLRLA